jgi:type II secretion system protein N
MNNIRKKFLYTAYILSVTVFFLFYLFPADVVKNKLSFAVAEIHPGLNLAIDKITPAFPPGLRLQPVEFYHHRALLLSAEQIKIAPVLLSLLNPPVKFVFKGRAYGGDVEGRGEFDAKQSDSKGTIGAQFAGIQIKEISVIQNLTDFKIAGLLDGKIKYDIAKISGRNLSAELVLSDCTIELLASVFILDTISFKKIEADIALNNNKLQLKQCILKGKQMDGTMSGTITLKNPFKDSVLKLSGAITPQPLLLENLSKIFPVNRKKMKQGAMHITIGGTFDKPDVFFQ